MKKIGRKISVLNIIFAVDTMLNVLYFIWESKLVRFVLMTEKYEMLIFVGFITIVPAMFLLCQVIYFIKEILGKNAEAFSGLKIMLVFSMLVKVIIIFILVVMEFSGVDVLTAGKELFGMF